MRVFAMSLVITALSILLGMAGDLSATRPAPQETTAQASHAAV